MNWCNVHIGTCTHLGWEPAASIAMKIIVRMTLNKLNKWKKNQSSIPEISRHRYGKSGSLSTVSGLFSNSSFLRLRRFSVLFFNLLFSTTSTFSPSKSMTLTAFDFSFMKGSTFAESSSAFGDWQEHGTRMAVVNFLSQFGTSFCLAFRNSRRLRTVTRMTIPESDKTIDRYTAVTNRKKITHFKELGVNKLQTRLKTFSY